MKLYKNIIALIISVVYFSLEFLFHLSVKAYVVFVNVL